MWLTNVDPYILNLIHNWKVEYRTHEMAQVIELLTGKPDQTRSLLCHPWVPQEERTDAGHTSCPLTSPCLPSKVSTSLPPEYTND